MKEGDIVSIRLVTGEYVIATYAGSQNQPGVIHLVDPLIYEVIPGKEKGQFGVKFTSLLPLGSPGCKIPLNLSATIYVSDEVHPEVAKRFQAIVSHIVVPGKGMNTPEVQIVQR